VAQLHEEKNEGEILIDLQATEKIASIKNSEE
jgi:hypothetical protein